MAAFIFYIALFTISFSSVSLSAQSKANSDYYRPSGALTVTVESREQKELNSTHLMRRDDLVQPANITVPVNYDAYTQGNFPPTSFEILNTDPVQFASFFAFGGGTAYRFSDTITPTTSPGATSTTSSGWSTATTSSASSNELSEAGVTPYVGRTTGGGNRSTIYGSARWGSGDGSINGEPPFFTPSDRFDANVRSYPYGFWPIYWGSINYGMSYWYRFDSLRPGGGQNLIMASLDVTREGDPYYFIIADAATISGLNTVLALPYEKGGCSMYSGNPVYLFEPDSISPNNGTRTLRSATGALPRQNITLVPQNVLQYYRSSSVALGSSVYQDEFGLGNNTQGLGYWGRTPFDVSSMLVVNRTDSTIPMPMNNTYAEHVKFVDCLNRTIAAAAPIVDPSYIAPVDPSQNTSVQSEIRARDVGIGVGVPVALMSIGAVIFIYRYRRRRSRTRLPTFRRVPLGRHTGGPRVVLMDRPIYHHISTSQPASRDQVNRGHVSVDAPVLPEEEELPPYSVD